MKLQKLTLHFTVLMVIAVFGTNTFASCPIMTPGPPCVEFAQARAVFIGVATSVVRIPNETGLGFGHYLRSTVHLSVEEAFKGVEGTVVVLDLDYCGHLFEEGQRYLVYAHYNSHEKKFEVRAGSTRTRIVSEATEDLAYIRSVSATDRASRVFGKAVQQGYKQVELEVQPLAGVKVSMESNDERREVVTDSEGRYEFKGLPEGTYRLRVEVPTYLENGEQTIKIVGPGCVPVDLVALYKGQIAGRLLDTNGKPVREIAVTLVSADAKPEQILPEGNDPGIGFTHFSNRDGGFRFSQLMPGRYLLIVNRKEFRSAKSELSRILPAFLYPGVHDIKSATVIVIAIDQKPQTYDFVLPIQQ